MLYGDRDDVINSKMTLRGEPINWDSPEGQALLKLLPPSDEEVKFNIAHEIAHLKTKDIFYGIGLSPIILVAGYHLAVSLCKR